jgi:hypothetical protein
VLAPSVLLVVDVVRLVALIALMAAAVVAPDVDKVVALDVATAVGVVAIQPVIIHASKHAALIVGALLLHNYIYKNF